MKIYFDSAKKQKTKTHTDILNFIKKLGHEIAIEPREDFDLMIADIEETSTALGCSIAIALTNRKPVLCLYSEKSTNKSNMLPPQQEKYFKFLTAKAYNKNNLQEIIKNFLEEKDEQMHSRFNFFVSSEISNYLDWITFNRQQSRADFIRRLIHEQLDEDKQYKSYLKNKRK